MEPIDVLRPTERELKEAIENYQNILNDSVALTTLFSQGHWFNYTKEHFEHHSSHVHAYPGMLGGHLVFLMIPSAYDHEGTKNIQDYVQLCPILTGERSNRISSKTALARINRWKDNYPTWIESQVTTEYGMFQAFDIDHQDFEEEIVSISLGLKSEVSGAFTFDRADLIVENDSPNALVFDDFARPVPPFGAVASANNFYLLTI
jgi:hypothetical protein